MTDQKRKVVLTPEIEETLLFIQEYGGVWMIGILQKAIRSIISQYQENGGDERQVLGLLSEVNSVIGHIEDLIPEENRKEAPDEEDGD